MIPEPLLPPAGAGPAIPWPTIIVTSILIAAAVLPSASARSQAAPDSARHRLSASSEPPWNPPTPAPAERPWETVVRAPVRVLAVPFALMEKGMKGTLGFVEDHDVIPRVAAHISVLERYGVIARPASLGDRTGWGGEIGINPRFFRSFVATVSGSTAGYNRTEVALEATEGLVAYQSDWRSRDPFFGMGSDSREEDASNFASQSQSARVELRYPFRRVVTRVFELLEDPAVSTESTRRHRHLFRAWAGPRDVVVLDGRERSSDRLPVSERFPSLAASQLETRVEHFVYGAEALIDRRSGRPHWWKGWRAMASAERFDEPVKALAFHSASTPSVQFTRFTYEGEVGISFWRDPRTFRLLARVVDQTGVTNPGTFLLTDLAMLGGSRGLAGFEPGRFRDADLVLGRLTYIFPIARYFEMDLHTEAGDVVRRLEDTRLDALKTSYGAALRVRTSQAPLASIGIDWSRETARFRFALGGVE